MKIYTNAFGKYVKLNVEYYLSYKSLTKDLTHILCIFTHLKIWQRKLLHGSYLHAYFLCSESAEDFAKEKCWIDVEYTQFSKLLIPLTNLIRYFPFDSVVTKLSYFLSK